MEKIIELDRQLFLFLNELHVAWLDQPMFLISTEWFWFPLYGFLVYLMVKKTKKQSWLPILAILVTVLLSDQISGKIKRSVQRYRPSHDILLENQVHTVNGYRGGMYGFVSSHAANTFAVAFFVSLFLELSFVYFQLLFFWAVLVSYSRLYLGVHFPMDLLCGGCLGLLIAGIVFLLAKQIEKKFFSSTYLP